jgi:hypothetical protein
LHELANWGSTYTAKKIIKEYAWYLESCNYSNWLKDLKKPFAAANSLSSVVPLISGMLQSIISFKWLLWFLFFERLFRNHNGCHCFWPTYVKS